MGNILLTILLFGFVLSNCASGSNQDYLLAQKANSMDAYKGFIEKHPDSPQVLKAKIQLEKLQGLTPKSSAYKLSSENSIQVIQKDGRFQETRGYLKQVLDFYKSKGKRDYFIGVDGIKIAYDYFPVEGATKALVISHGTGESSIRYAEVVYDLLNNKVPYSIFVINHRGHGFSQRLLGKYKEWDPKWDVYNVTQEDILEYRKIHVKNFDDYIKDFSQLVSIIKDKYHFEKVSALGHSLGGGVVARYVEQHPKALDKIILSAPMFSLIGLLGADNTDFISKAIISIKDTFSSTSYTFGGESFNHFVTTHDSDQNSLNYYTTSYNRFFMKKFIIQEFPETSLGGSTWGFADAAYEGVKDIRWDSDKIQIPTLILQAGYDDYVHPSAQNKICDKINGFKSGLCTLKIFKDSKHELLLERDIIRNEVMNLIIDNLMK